MAQDNISGTGSLKISEDVLATIASIAAKEINGVTGLVTTPTQGFKMMFSKKGNSRGIIMEYIDGEAVLNLFINIKNKRWWQYQITIFTCFQEQLVIRLSLN